MSKQDEVNEQILYILNKIIYRDPKIRLEEEMDIARLKRLIGECSNEAA